MAFEDAEGFPGVAEVVVVDVVVGGPKGEAVGDLRVELDAADVGLGLDRDDRLVLVG